MNKVSAVVLPVISMFPLVAYAQDDINPFLVDRHMFTLGAYFQTSDNKISSTRNGFEEREIDLERLGVDDEYVSFQANYQWRFADRWALVVTGHTFSSDGSRTIEESFTFDGQEFEVGAELDSELSVDTLLIDVFYSIYKTDNAEIRLGGGLHAFNFEVELSAEASVGEREVGGSFADEQILAPLPNLRADGVYALSSRWAIYAGAGWVSAEVDDYDGSYVFANVKTDFRITDGLALGVGYQFIDTDVTYTSSKREVVFNTNFQGPTAFLTYSF